MWEITMRTESPAVSEPMTTVVCISKEEAEDPKPPRHKATDDCKVTSGGRSGSILSYAVKCGRKKSESTARFTYNGDQFEGVVEGKTDDGNFRQVYTARRIGDCEEAPTPELP
ncbi:MAG TPA: DUF3617 family protein [Thermoanaerobaculia bacterium]|nr:DUF3617 family protein [Thermoanaerobaculia bacterium]